MADTADQESISGESLLVFEHHDHSTHFHGNVHIQGSNVATGGSKISDASAAFKNNDDISAAFKALRPLLKEVSEPHKEAVAKALEVLIKGAEKNSITEVEAAQATRTIAEHAPSITNELKHVAASGALHVFGGMLFEWIKTALLGA